MKVFERYSPDMEAARKRISSRPKLRQTDHVIGSGAADGPPSDSSTPDAGLPRKRRVRTVVLTTLGVIGVLLVVAFVVLYAFFRRDLAQAKDRLASIPTDIYASRYGDIQYHVVGDGPAVLISHGITGGVDAGQYLVTRWRNQIGRASCRERVL